MIPTIKGEKLGMTSVFDGAGTTLAVTLVRPHPAVVTQIKTPERDGYSAVQLAYGDTSSKHVNRPAHGVLDRAGVKDPYASFYEVRLPEEALNDFKLGQEIAPSEFLLRWAEVDVCGTSKGKGFAGGVKRWGFRGQCRSHGDPDNRRPMSSGATDPARVFKGSHRPGQMGNARTTVKSCAVFEYYRALNVLVIKGSVPGPTGGELTLTVTKEFTPEELAEHEAQITLDEKQAALFKADGPETEASASQPEEPETVADEETEAAKEPAEPESEPVVGQAEAEDSGEDEKPAAGDEDDATTDAEEER
jgi:large subunit ribosomal protein L3